MDATALERSQRAGEYFRDLRVLPGAWAVVRVDGRGFTRFAQALFAKPFDARFSEYMVNTAECLLVELGGVYAFTESDEISVLLPRSSELFDRRLEQLISVSAGIASAAFTHVAGELAHFDATLWMGVEESAVADYFCSRQAEAAAGALDVWCNWALRLAGQTRPQAAESLRGLSTGDKRELLGANGIRFDELPAWQRRGVGLRWQQIDGWSFDGGRATMSSVVRRQIVIERDLPGLDEYRAHVHAVVTEQLNEQLNERLNEQLTEQLNEQLTDQATGQVIEQPESQPVTIDEGPVGSGTADPGATVASGTAGGAPTGDAPAAGAEGAESK